MDDKRLIDVTKLLKKQPIEEIRKSIEDDKLRKSFLSELKITESEFAAYLSTNVKLKVDDVTIQKTRKQVIQAMHSCC